MYIIILTYQKELSEVEKHLKAHRTYLDKHYASGPVSYTHLTLPTNREV